ncbi:MAG: helix-turn-helix domain-containing protein [Armatimonadetes bacterium]|nr:helix-turn-helix domain-containing protein [Armatimonadota bacterium]
MLLDPKPPHVLNVRAVRRELGLTQSRLADLTSVSLRTIQGCEQGWRKPSPGLEKLLLLLLINKRAGTDLAERKCWVETVCPPEVRAQCPAYQAAQGGLCWLMTGKLYRGLRLPSWAHKRAMCEKCPLMRSLLGDTTGLFITAEPTNPQVAVEESPTQA